MPDKQETNINKRVLLMEDDEACLKIMHHKLKQLDYQVDLTRDGIKAIHFIQNVIYDLIIIDIRLYGASGKDVIQCVRDSKLNTNTFLLVWSAFVNKNNEEKYLSWGADGALVKWCSSRELKNMIRNM